MSITTAQIRQAAGKRVGECITGTTTALGTTTTLIDTTKLGDSNASQYSLVGGWVLFTSGANIGAIRRISSYAPATGIIGWTTALSNAVASSVTYEIHTIMDPDEWFDCINYALNDCTRRRQETINVVDGQKQYSLSSFTDIIESNQVYKLELRFGDVSDQYTYHELPVYMWNIREDDDSFVLDVRYPFPYNPSQIAIIMHYYGPYSQLTDKIAGTTNCPLEWVTIGAIKYMWELYGHHVQKSQFQIVGLERDEAIREWLRLSTKYGPEITYPVRVPWQ